MPAFQLDDPVKVKFTLMTGTVVGAEMNPATFELRYMVEYTDNFGEPQKRVFEAAQIEPA